MNKQAKHNQRHWNWEQADSDQSGDGRGLKGKGWRVSRNNYKENMDNNKGTVETGEGGVFGCSGIEGGEKIQTTEIEQQ